MKKKFFTRKLFALLLASSMAMSAVPVWANYGGYDEDVEEPVIEQDFYTSTLEMTVGEETDLNDNLSYTADSYKWDYDSSMVSVRNGRVTAKSEGYTVVTATHDYEVWAFKIGIESGQTEENRTEYVSVTVGVDAEEGLGQYIELGTSDYSWSSDNPSVATVTRGGVLKGVSKGSTKVYANRTSGTSFVFNVTVEGSGSSKTSEKNLTYYAGDIDILSSYVGNEATDYKWTTSNSSVVATTSVGNITALKAGNATVRATPYDVSTEYIFYITVKSNSNAAERDISMSVDATKDLSSYVSGSAKKYDWASDNKSVATVSSSGVVTAKKKGTAVISVYESGASNEKYIFNVTVKSSSSSSSSSSIDEKYTIYMGKDDSVDISDFIAKNASNYDWSTSDSDVCKVSGGKIRSVDTGSATVKASGSKNYQFNVKVSKSYSNYDVNINGTFDPSKYLDDDVSKYRISYYDTGYVKLKDDKFEGLKRGVTYIILENKRSTEIVQLMVNVTGVAQTTEKTTEATTHQKETRDPEPVTQAPAKKGPDFQDISHRQWAVPAINNMASKGYINGRSNTVFAPDDQCSKADFTIVLTKMIGIENDDYTGGFDDVSSDKYYAKYVNVARHHGICAGVSGNNFKPQNSITREEVMYMVYMGLKLKGRDLDTNTDALGAYSDADEINDDYRVAVAALLNEGIVSGVSATEIDPRSTITRAQMAVLLNNIGM